MFFSANLTNTYIRSAAHPRFDFRTDRLMALNWSDIIGDLFWQTSMTCIQSGKKGFALSLAGCLHLVKLMVIEINILTCYLYR
jgi:hypothetical protein